MITERSKKIAIKTAQDLVSWYESQQRDLPWRSSKPDPYKVWISEVMLQQTTSQAVKAYYKSFLDKWPTVIDLSEASIEEVYEKWQGLGYYSRARNVLKTAKIVADEMGANFPDNAAALIKLPGIGSYTASAIASICFEEPIGVVDGNVLRVFNRLIGEKVEWWTPSFQKRTQVFSTELCSLGEKPSKINQALMDLGATICTPKSPACMLCPIQKVCTSKKDHTQLELPIQRPKKAKEIWLYEIYKKSPEGEVLHVEVHENQPVLKTKPLPKGRFKKLDKKPKSYAFTHSITHHQIYVDFKKAPKSLSNQRSRKITLNELVRTTPSSLIKKIWQSKGFHESI
jgi:A/G-specific adenine glycosylase